MTAISEQEDRAMAICARIEEAAHGRDRLIVAIAGAPGSGKSTLSDRLCRMLNAQPGDVAAVMPMDGFHLDDGVLREKGTLARKGAPFTFDFGGLSAMLARLKANREDSIAVPLFDRDLEISRAGARIIAKSRKIVIVEGNYLLLDQAPWSGLRQYFDLTIALAVPFATLEERLVRRWLDQGLSPEQALKRARENDIVNARLVRDHGLAADLVVSTAQDAG